MSRAPDLVPFADTYRLSGGIVRTLAQLPRLSPAQASNLLSVTAALYEPLWRRRSLSLISGGAVDTDSELAQLSAWAQGLGEGRFLDLGSSSGFYARHLARDHPALRVHALDVSLPFLRTLVALAERDGLELTAVHGDALDLPYRDGSFDAVASGGTLNELGSLSLALTEQARVLRPGGRLWSMHVVRAERPFGRALQRAMRAGGLYFPSADEVLALADGAGLDFEAQEIWPPLAIARFRRRDHPG